ncbi:MAG: hypothetical protein ABIG84_05325 [archaeon]
MFKKFWKKAFESEKNLEVRKRHEERVKYHSAVLLAILLAGGFVVGKTTLADVISGTLLTIIISVIYILILIYIEKYSDYTDKLIKKSDSEKKKYA